ncbi:6-phosphofructo-2-kinase 1 [Gonapodya sp. JEL0774]|nr:6-phosphofructo-2-kinase 1 [Gonapodya sp. JEL0774]
MHHSNQQGESSLVNAFPTPNLGGPRAVSKGGIPTPALIWLDPAAVRSGPFGGAGGGYFGPDNFSSVGGGWVQSVPTRERRRSVEQLLEEKLKRLELEEFEEGTEVNTSTAGEFRRQIRKRDESREESEKFHPSMPRRRSDGPRYTPSPVFAERAESVVRSRSLSPSATSSSLQFAGRSDIPNNVHYYSPFRFQRRPKSKLRQATMPLPALTTTERYRTATARRRSEDMEGRGDSAEIGRYQPRTLNDWKEFRKRDKELNQTLEGGLGFAGGRDWEAKNTGNRLSQIDDDINFDSDSDAANMMNSGMISDDDDPHPQAAGRSSAAPEEVELSDCTRGAQADGEGTFVESKVVQPIPINTRNHPHSRSEPGTKVTASSVPVFGPADVQNPSVYFQLAPDPSAISKSLYLREYFPDGSSGPSSSVSSPGSHRFHRPLVSELPVQYGSSVLKTSINHISLPYQQSEMIARRNQIRAASDGHGSSQSSRASSYKALHDIQMEPHERSISGSSHSSLPTSLRRSHANSDPPHNVNTVSDSSRRKEEIASEPSSIATPPVRHPPEFSGAQSETLMPPSPRVETPPLQNLPSPISSPSPSHQSPKDGAASLPKSPNVSYLSQKLSLERPAGISSPGLSPMSADVGSPLLGPTKKALVPIIAEDTRLVVVMVGLPARGKTYISRKISRYMSWIGYSSRIFNVGEYRRELAENDPSGVKQDAAFFDPFNKEASRIREEAAQRCMEDLVRWSQSLSSGCVAIFDATNTTKMRRKQLYDYFTGVVDGKGNPMQVIFVESVVTGEFGADVVRRNVTEVKLSGPDYLGTDPDVAMRDFLERIKQYEKVYQTMEEDEGVPFVKVMSVRFFLRVSVL